jgi:hypothetical protein
MHIQKIGMGINSCVLMVGGQTRLAQFRQQEQRRSTVLAVL